MAKKARPKMKSIGKKDRDFVSKFAEYYRMLFSDTAKNVTLLADIQKNFPEDYKSFAEFGKDPAAIDYITRNLDLKKQALLFNMLLKAGGVGRRLSMLLESTEREKRILIKDLATFIKELDALIKSAQDG